MTSNGGAPAYDAVVVGGGIAGLTFAYQLKQELAEARILLVDRNQHPVGEAAFKVGESTSEVAAFYLDQVLGLREHLLGAELRKLGVRFFLPAGANTDIAARLELGLSDWSYTTTFQLDRGRFENFMTDLCRASGVEVLESASVESVQLDSNGHTVEIVGPDATSQVTCRWLVDASGRRNFLKRQLGLDRRLDHEINAAWFRVAGKVDIGEWSDDPDFRSRVAHARRWLSTNHLMGRGYWVWLIPLASGSTSIGVVTDPSIIPMKQLARLDRVQTWLRENEPQCAAALEGLPVQDFRVMHTYAYMTERAVSADRWLLTGESAIFFDPLYSPGSDFIAMWNTLLSWLVAKDLRGEDVSDLAETINTFLVTATEFALAYWKGAYPVMGSPTAMAYKLLWDIASYFVAIASPWTHTLWRDVGFLFALLPILSRFTELNFAVQGALQARAVGNSAPLSPGFVDFNRLHQIELNRQIIAPMDPEEVIPIAQRNLKFLEELAALITGDASLSDGTDPEARARALAELEPIRLVGAAGAPSS